MPHGVYDRTKSKPRIKKGKVFQCKICNKEFYVKKSELKIRKYCSRKCAGKDRSPLSKAHKRKIALKHIGIKLSERHKDKIRKTRIRKGIGIGNNNPNWRGGIINNGLGYILIYSPNHPFCTKDKYLKRSRLVMEKYIGRYLKLKERVHHKGIRYPINSVKNKQDDKIDNLKLFPNESKHQLFHYKLRKTNKLGQFL